MRRCVLICLWFSSLAGLMHAQDIPFEKVLRAIKKEPAYQDKPRYVLITTGQSLQHRHWLVLDGKTLYFDRNGNGDITEPGERLTPTSEWSDDTQLHFQLGDLQQDGRTHVKLKAQIRTVQEVSKHQQAPSSGSVDKNAPTLELWGEFAVPGFRGRCDYGRVPRHVGPFDHDGYLLWKPTPKEASIVNFGEAWSVQLHGLPKLLMGVEDHVVVTLGSRGLGTGTFALVGYENIVPGSIHPRLKLLYSDRNGAGLQEHVVVLQERC